jgi:hypothetical protein
VWILSYSLSSPASASGVVAVMRGWGEDRRRNEIDGDRDSEDLGGGGGRSWTGDKVRNWSGGELDRDRRRGEELDQGELDGGGDEGGVGPG